MGKNQARRDQAAREGGKLEKRFHAAILELGRRNFTFQPASAAK
jgi:hypothetical protein